MKVFAELQSRGCQDILIAVTDGLTGMPDALAAVYPMTTLQTCIVHLIRHSLESASWRDRRVLVALKTVYTAPTEDAARTALEAFAASPLGQQFPTVVAAWRRAWIQVIPFFAFPPRGASSALHHHRPRKCASAAAQDHQDAGPVPNGRGGHSIDLAGSARQRSGIHRARHSRYASCAIGAPAEKKRQGAQVVP